MGTLADIITKTAGSPSWNGPNEVNLNHRGDMVELGPTAAVAIPKVKVVLRQRSREIGFAGTLGQWTTWKTIVDRVDTLLDTRTYENDEGVTGQAVQGVGGKESDKDYTITLTEYTDESGAIVVPPPSPPAGITPTTTSTFDAGPLIMAMGAAVVLAIILWLYFSPSGRAYIFAFSRRG